MRGKRWIFGIAKRGVLVAAALFAAAGWGRAQQASADASVLRIPAGQVQFHIGDDPRCAGGVDPGCAWQPKRRASLPGRSNPKTVYWGRSQVTLPEAMRRTPELAVLVQAAPAFYEMYANGHDLGGTSGKSFWNSGTDTRRILAFPSSYAPDGRLTLVMRADPKGPVGVGAIGASLNPPPVVLAPADRIQLVADAETLAYLRLNATHYLCFAVVGFAAFVFLLLFSVNTRLRENLWLGASLGAVAMLRVGEISRMVDFRMPLWLGGIVFLACNSLTPFLLIEFVFAFLHRPVPKFFRFIQILGFVEWYSVAGLPAPSFLDPYWAYALSTAILVATLTQLLMLPTCFKSKLPEMRWIGASVLFYVVENAARMVTNVGLPGPAQDVMWHGLDIDVRGIAYSLFALVMLVAMTFRLRRIQNRNREIEQEMAAARSVQQILIPEELPLIPGLAVESAYLPAQQVGGDFYQVLPSGDGGLLLVVGDVSGKGLPAAMLVSVLVGAIRSTAEFTKDPAELLAHLNERLVGRSKSGGFSTALAALVSADGRVTIANAGHLSPYLNGKEVELPNALPLGIVSGSSYNSIHFQMGPGSRLAFYSDGVVEAQNEKGELFGFERGQQISTRPAAAIVEAARRFGQSDDITVVTIERLAADEELAAGRVEPILAPA